MFKVLVCDYSCIVRSRLKLVLEKEGYQVYEAVKLEQIRNDTFSPDISLDEIDLIILDVCLGQDSGFAVLEYIKDSKLNIPTVMISEDDRLNTIRKALQLGVVDYILKPFNETTVLQRLKFINNTDSNLSSKQLMAQIL
ncbi:MAG: response regulator [Bacillota bacterium]